MIRGSAEKPTMGTQPVVDVDVIIVVDVEVSSSRKHRCDTTDCILLLVFLALVYHFSSFLLKRSTTGTPLVGKMRKRDVSWLC